MQLTIHTERGDYTSKISDVTADQADQVREQLQISIEKGTYFRLETETGYVIISGNLLRNAVFVVKA